MKTLVQLWPWWSFALLFLNTGLGLAVVLVLHARGSLPQLSALRFYLWYSVAAGALGLAVAIATPVGKLWYWRFLTGANIGFDLATFFLCTQIVDQLIRREDVQRVKRLWLFGLPAAFAITVLVGGLAPGRSVGALLAFDALAMAMAGACVLGAYITPAEDWLPGYPAVILGLGWQIVSGALQNLVFELGRYRWLDIVSPLASAMTLGIFLWAASEGTARFDFLFMSRLQSQERGASVVIEDNVLRLHRDDDSE